MNYKFWFNTITLSLALLITMTMLPYNDYIKYQGIKTGVYEKSKWLYERSFFDETPVDVAFFGTSHTLLGINASVIQTNVSQALNRQISVVNYSIPQLGRDMHYPLLKMLLENKTPDLVVIEVRESEARDLHPGTHYLASTQDLITAPLFVNLRYVDNIYRQPGRNLKLSIVSIWPELFSYQEEFDSLRYNGKHVFEGKNQLVVDKGADRVQTKEWLDRERAKQDASAPYKYNEVTTLESFLYFNANNTYLDRMTDLLKSNGIDLLFLYLPDYKTTNLPLRDIYSHKAKLIDPGPEFHSRPDVWADRGHLNRKGGKEVTNIMRDEILSYYESKNQKK
jgi:hypothetical protein